MDLATLKALHPQWNIVDWKEGPQGQGIIALGADGGIFALDSAGGTTGVTAPLAYYGGTAFSYTSLAPELRSGNVPFTSIDVSPQGYILRNANQQTFGFSYPAPATPTGAGPVNTAGTQQATDTSPNQTAGDVSGSAAIHAVLDPLGLGSLADQALQTLHSTPSADANYITQVWLPQQTAFKQLFPEIAQTQAQAAADPTGRTHIPTPAEIVTYRQYAQQLATQGILPSEFVSNDQIGKLITGGVSLSEFQGRVNGAITSLTMAPQAEKDAFLAYHPAVDFSHAVGALLDPTLGEAAVNRAVAQAAVGGRATMAGYGNLSQTQADQLAAAGQGSQSQFTTLAMEKPLFSANLGENGDIGSDTQLATLTGDAAAIAQVENRRAARGAQFQGGGGGASGGTGGQGLGST